MGNKPTILNANAQLLEAGEIQIDNTCNYILCSPNISNFCDYKNNKKIILNNNFIRFYILLLFMMFIFIFIIKYKKMI